MNKIKICIKKKISCATEIPQDINAYKTDILEISNVNSFSNISDDENLNDLVISFDVGIINLAYCILKYVNGKLQIYDWNIINMASGNQKLLCTFINDNTKKKCTHKAYYTLNKDGYCLTHGKTISKNLAEPLQRNITVANVTELELKTLLFTALDSNPIFLKPNIVLVEQQPLKGMEKIRGVGHALFDYFVLRGILDQKKEYKCMKFIDAKNKLTLYDGPFIECHLKTQYARNKWYAEQYCNYIIKDLKYESSYFSNFKQKKDDLADCFLQGLWYIKFGQDGKQAPITSNHQKLVYSKNNSMSYKKVRAHAPSKKIIASGKYTLSNIKYMLNKKCPMEDLKSSIEFYFGSVQAFKDLNI